MSKKAIKKSLKKSVGYSITFAFSILLLVTSIYGLPTASASRFSSDKNSGSFSRIEGAYKRYCLSDESNTCFYIIIDNHLESNYIDRVSYYNVLDYKIVSSIEDHSNLIRAPPIS